MAVQAVKVAGRSAADKAAGRGPGWLHQAVTLALLLVIALLAVNAPREAPPAIAEIAPQAIQQITEAPEEQSSNVGEQDASGEEGDSLKKQEEDPSRVPDAADEGEERPTQYRCVGTPPRQIEDPQSPPCIPFWDEAAGNGGATSPGVTGNEIRVVVSRRQYDEAVVPDAVLELLEDFFNKRFQFYGRQLELIPFSPTPDGYATVDQMDSDAELAKQIGAFAAVSLPERAGVEQPYWEGLARRKIIGVGPAANYVSFMDEDVYRRNAPYLWSYLPSWDRLQRNTAEFMCKGLKDNPPVHAKGQQREIPKRKFGVVFAKEHAELPAPDLTVLTDALRSCDAPFLAVEFSEGDRAAAIAAVQRLSQEGVTTVIFSGHTGTYSTRFIPVATGQGFTPEYLIWNAGHQDDDYAGQYYQNVADSAFGVQVWNKWVPRDQLPSTWALKEMDATVNGNPAYEYVYKELLLLASGIQMAGPQLTPHNFEKGLHGATFPNPGNGGAPLYQARVGFPGGVHSMVQDQTQIWLSLDEVSPLTGHPPSYCYVGSGTRYRTGEWPGDEAPFFSGTCR